MPTSIYVLFFTALIAGAVAFYIPQLNTGAYKLWLVFAGSYLFSITLIHIFPEMYIQGLEPSKVGVCVLIGFFLQQGLEFLSHGVEHGHIHVHKKNHQRKESTAVLVLLALCVHAFLEGGLLAHPRTVHHHHDSNTLLWGIVLHKAPEAFALMSVLLCEVKSKRHAVFFLLIFALSSPLGLFLSNYLLESQWMTAQSFTILFAIVSGNFLHISTTIVFESSAHHQFNARKMGVAVLAAFIAVATELFL